MIVDGIIRLIVVCFAFFCAALGAAAFFVLASLGLDWFAPLEGGDVVDATLRIGLFAGAVVSVAAMVWAVPVLLTLAVAEALRLRSIVAWLLLGAAVGGVAVILWDDGTGRAGQTEYLIGTASGIAGAFVYWLLAGRSAGRWWERAAKRQRETA